MQAPYQSLSDLVPCLSVVLVSMVVFFSPQQKKKEKCYPKNTFIKENVPVCTCPLNQDFRSLLVS